MTGKTVRGFLLNLMVLQEPRPRSLSSQGDDGKHYPTNTLLTCWSLIETIPKLRPDERSAAYDLILRGGKHTDIAMQWHVCVELASRMRKAEAAIESV